MIIKTIFLLIFSTALASQAVADIAPGPEDPCYQIKDGAACTSRDGKSGICIQTCSDRLDPGTGKKMYSTCNSHCQSPTPVPQNVITTDKSQAAKTPTN